MDCCSEFATPCEGTSPFQKNIVLGYYDGPTDGLVQCKRCSRVFRYKIVAWDQGQDSRIFVLFSRPMESFQQMEHLLLVRSTPRYPDWVVWLNECADAQKRQMADVLQSDPEDVANAAYLIMGESPTGRLHARPIEAEVRQIIASDRWQANRIDDIGAWSRYFEQA